ncbi:MAG: DUF5723 family protein [Chitinophagales bacterium]|nr:DUF5723 family protein [Chitinophagales bacterium]MDW8418331.1 DUF5723 family protein [Chitinophagales bacterium]
MNRGLRVYCILFCFLYVNIAFAFPDSTNHSHKVHAGIFDFSSPSLSNPFNEHIGDSALNRITIDFDYITGSNTAPFQFAAGMLFGAQVKQKIIDRTHQRIRKQIRFYDQMKTGIVYRRYLKNFDGEVFLGYHHRQFRNLSAGKQAYELVFYGNAQFEDKTIDLSNIRVQNFIYNQYSLGVFKEFQYPRLWMEFGVSLSFLQCANHQQIFTRQSSLYTAPDGEYLDIQYDLTFNGAREGAVGFYQLNGKGVSGDLHLALKKPGNWRVGVDLRDVGHLYFRKAPYNYTAANTVRFQGIVLPDLLKLSPGTFDTLNLDSAVRANLPQRSNREYGTMTPMQAQLVFSKSLLRSKLVLNAGLNYILIPNYFFCFIKTNYFIRPDMVVSGTAGAGTYNMLHLGAEFTKQWKYFDITFGSNNLPGFMAPAVIPGASLYLRFGCRF